MILLLHPAATIFLSSFQHSNNSGDNIIIAAEKKGRCSDSDQGMVINWDALSRLSWEDFQAPAKGVSGFAVATATSRFDYQTKWTNDQLKVRVRVRFFCHESWKNPRISIPEVLEHEQIHFDICEIYGRIFYGKILEKREQSKLNERELKKIYAELMEEYDQYQDRYDEETDYSTNGRMQNKWKNKITAQLKDLEKFAAYKEF